MLVSPVNHVCTFVYVSRFNRFYSLSFILFIPFLPGDCHYFAHRGKGNFDWHKKFMSLNLDSLDSLDLLDLLDLLDFIFFIMLIL